MYDVPFCSFSSYEENVERGLHSLGVDVAIKKKKKVKRRPRKPQDDLMVGRKYDMEFGPRPRIAWGKI